jgi:hypothetical protein
MQRMDEAVTITSSKNGEMKNLLLSISLIKKQKTQLSSFFARKF